MLEKIKSSVVKKIKEIDKKDRNKIVITSIVVLVLLYKIVFPEINYMFGKKYDIDNEIYGSDNSYSEDNDYTNIKDLNKDKSQLGINKNVSNKDNILKADVDDKKINIKVYITGAVSNPGVITLESGKRLDDAVKLLGGMTKDADYNRINLAMELNDGQHYIIPFKGDDRNNSINESQVSTNTGNNTSEDQNNTNEKININLASASELESIPGVGPSTSKKIIDYREKNGKFAKKEDIKNVSGIGEKKFENMKDYIDIK